MDTSTSSNLTDMEKAVLESIKLSSEGKTLNQIKVQVGSFMSINNWSGALNSQLTISLSNLEKQGKVVKSGIGSSARYKLK